MTREEAAQVLQEQIEFIEDCQAYSMLTKSMYEDGYKRMDAYKLAIAALRGSQPEPDTGLMPCGCGGKAKIWPSSLRQDMTTDHAVVCTECAIVTGWVRGKQENAVRVWNTAMGWKDGAGHPGGQKDADKAVMPSGANGEAPTAVIDDSTSRITICGSAGEQVKSIIKALRGLADALETLTEVEG